MLCDMEQQLFVKFKCIVLYSYIPIYQNVLYSTIRTLLVLYMCYSAKDWSSLLVT